MLLRKDHTVRGAALAIVLATGAAAQTTFVTEQLDAGEKLPAQGRYNDARILFANLLRDVNSGRGGGRLAAIVLDNVGISETYAGNYGAAETAFNQSLTLLRQAAATMRGDGHAVALSEIYDNLAVVCVMRRKRAEAETLLRNSTALLEKQVGIDNPRFADPLLTYAGLLVVEHRYTDTVVPAERAWQILGKSDAAIADSYLAGAASILASVYYHVARWMRNRSHGKRSNWGSRPMAPIIRRWHPISRVMRRSSNDGIARGPSKCRIGPMPYGHAALSIRRPATRWWPTLWFVNRYFVRFREPAVRERTP